MNIHCPRCGCNDYRTNQLQPFGEERYAQAVQAARVANFVGVEALVTAAWSINRAVNALRHAFRCNNCDLPFSPPRDHVSHAAG